MSNNPLSWDDINEDDENFDYKKLYVTNIPVSLNQSGFDNTFLKFGVTNMSFLSPDAAKRYGLVRYETVGEAKTAMFALNNTPPLYLRIQFSKKKPDNKSSSRNNFLDKRTVSMTTEQPNDRHFDRTDTESLVTATNWGSRTTSNKDIMDTETLIGDNSIKELDDEDLALESEKLKVLIAQYQYKVKLREYEKKSHGGKQNIQITMKQDGKQIKTIEDRARGPNDGILGDYPGDSTVDSSSAVGMPALSARCIKCATTTGLVCGMCRATPYCSLQCQRADWAARHAAICSKGAGGQPTGGDSSVTSVQPLRKPRLPQTDAARPSSSTDGDTVVPPYRDNRNKNLNNNYDNTKKRYDNTKTYNNKYGQDNIDGDQADNRHKKGYNKPNYDSDYKNKTNQDGGSKFNQGGKFNKTSYNPRSGQDRNDDGWNVDRRDKVHEGTKKFEGYNSNNYKNAGGRKFPPAGQRSPAPLKRDAGNDEEEIWETPKAQNTEVVKTAEKVVESAAAKPSPVAEVKRTLSEETPRNCVIDLVSIGTQLILTIVESAKQCRSDGDYVCVVLTEAYEKEYQGLLVDYTTECEAIAKKDYKPRPGELYSLLEPTEGAWYRARHLGDSAPSALVDAARLFPVPADAQRAPLSPTSVHATAPEFTCVLCTSAVVKIGDALPSEVVSRGPDGSCLVKLFDINGQSLGEGTLRRWRPTVETPANGVKSSTEKAAQRQPSPPAISSPVVSEMAAKSPAGTPAVASAPAEPERPPLRAGVTVMVDVTALDRLFLYVADEETHRAFHETLHTVVMYGKDAEPLEQPPLKGQVVIAKFTDDNHYRALVSRTNVKQNKYLLEYIEFGNTEIAPLERLYSCPAEFDLSSMPALVSRAKLHAVTEKLTAEALDYLESLKDTPLVLSLPEGAKTAPSGSGVILKVEKNSENVNTKIQEMCKPQWKKMQEQGVNILETKITMLHDLQYAKLPTNGGELQILDTSVMDSGILSACEFGDPNIPHVIGPLAERLAEYCESEMGRLPYLPRSEEVCIARRPPHKGWYRAVLAEQRDGPGTAKLTMLYLDYGNIADVTHEDVRRMPPEFAEFPALACSVIIIGLERTWSSAAVAKAKKIMGIEEGKLSGKLRVTKCKLTEHGMYEATAPELVAALKPLM